MRTASALGVVVSLLFVGTAHADPFTILPDGSVVFNAEMTSSGTFTCRGGITCSGSGTSSVTIGSPGNTATLTFSGVSSAFPVSGDSTRVNIGTFEGTATAGFTFPRRTNPNLPILSFDLTLAHTSPVAASRRKRFSFLWPGDDPDLTRPIVNNHHLAFPIGSNPAGFHYTAIVYSFLPPISIASSGATRLDARVGAIPEPSTLLLLGAGLASGEFARRRKRASPR